MVRNAVWESVFRRIGLGGAVLLLGACGAGLSDSAVVPVTPTVTVTLAARGTLPPTWTPSPTSTPAPTRTATPVPSVTPTASAADICAGFELLHDFSSESTYPWDGYIPILARLDSSGAWIRFTATHRISGAGTGFELPGGQTIAMEFQMRALPRPGTYDWTLSVRTDAYGEICTQSGSFLALRPTATPIATAPAEVTAEATAEPDDPGP